MVVHTPPPGQIEGQSQKEGQSLSERLRQVRVGVRPELEISRHLLNGRPAYVVRDPISFQTLRLTPENYQIFVTLNPDQELNSILESLIRQGILEADQSESFYEFVLRLTQFGLLTLPISDGAGLYRRFRQRRASELKAKMTGFLFLRVPLICPDAFLTRTMNWFTPLFTRAAFSMWLVALTACSLLIHARWDEFINPTETVLATQNLPVLWTLLVVLKVLHEFGHAYACKRFGGNVPEMGAFFIAFTPCAYVDASASWGFPSRWHRIVVALAGMYFESIIAMAAIMIWCVTPSGQLHSIAQYTVILSTVVSIGFNANPLMKYDGYYVLSDLIGMPNLRADAQRAWAAMLKRVFFGLRTDRSSYPTHTRMLLVLFGVLSGIYKFVVVAGISLMLAFMLPAVGIAMAGLYLCQTTTQWISSLLRLTRSPEAAPAKARILAVVGAIATIAIVALIAFPMPGSVQGSGVLERSGDAAIRAEVAGFLEATQVTVGDNVVAGQSLCRLENADLLHNVTNKRLKIRQLEVQLQQDLRLDLQSAAVRQQHLQRARAEYEQLRRNLDSLLVRAPQPGQVTNAELLRNPGQYVNKGDVVATISSGNWIVKTLVTAEDLNAAHPEQGQPVEICFPGNVNGPLTGTIIRMAPAGSRIIENESLTHIGGGFIPVSGEAREALEPFFELTVSIDDATAAPIRHGMTALIRLNSVPTPIAKHLYRRGLQLLYELRVAS